MALERSLGVTLLRRTPRRVELTAEGELFLADCRRVLAAADRAARRVQAAARGEVGTLRLSYTLTTVWETIPKLLARLAQAHPQVKVEAREVRLDEQAAGNTVWGNLARGRGVALINASLAEQLPRGISLIELAEPTATLTYDAVWHQGERPLIQWTLQAAAQLSSEAGWL